MIPRLNGTSELFLVGLDRIQSNLNDVNRQMSSGLRVGQASDDPSAVPGILADQAQLAANTQSIANLNQVTTELQTGDGALQSAVQSVEQAITLATQAASTNSGGSQTELIGQVQDIQQQLVALSNTTVNGRYIFSGDLDQQPMYTLDATQPEGVQQLITPTSTRTITDAAGNALWTPKTAQDIFDPKNADGTPATGNVFAAVNGLLTALQNNDTAGASTAVDSLKSADDHLNQQLGLIGIAEDRVTNATNAANSSTVGVKADLSNLRDADIAGDALALSQDNLQQQAALSAQSKMSQLSLFDYLA